MGKIFAWIKDRKILIIFLIILLIFLIITFNLAFLPEIKYHAQEAVRDPISGNINYIISSDFISKGAFVVNNNVKTTINITSINGRNLKDASAEIFLCGGNSDCYISPINVSNNLWTGAIIPSSPHSYYNISEDGKEISGRINMQFSLPGEYPLYLIRITFLDGEEYIWPSSKNIIVEPPSILFQLESYRWMIITLIITIIGLVFNLIITSIKK